MFKKFLFYLRKSDWQLVLAVIFLVAFGLMAIYSIDSAAEEPDFQNFTKQLIFFGIGTLLLIVLSFLDYRYLKSFSYVLFGIGVVMLILVLVFGTEVRGTRGWFFFFGDQGFQPVELIKIFLIIILARLFADWRAEIVLVKNLLIVFAVGLTLVGLVILQPDFGSAVILLTIVLGMLALVIKKKQYWVVIVIVLAVLFIGSWFFVFEDYQKERITTFLNPEHDPYKSGYNITQSIIAVGSGNLFGRGLGLGPQSRLNFLPVQETDFIFAVIAEELGLVGSTLVLICIGFLLYRIIRVARFAQDDFGAFLACGIGIYIIVQSILNIGMNIGVLPIAGVPLPFLSYGGSSLLVSFLAIGIVQSVYARSKAQLQ